jgi:hypothetical protein
MAKWDLAGKCSDQGKQCTDEQNDSAQGHKDLEGFKDGYMEHKKLKHICTGVHNGSDA